MNIRPKSASTTAASAVTKQPHINNKVPVGTKKIDMGAAASFGKTSKTTTSHTSNAAGIHSPTHRDTPAEGNNDLIGYTSIDNNNISMGISQFESNNTTTANNNNVENLFQTCSPKSEKNLNSTAAINDDIDDFNPRATEQAPSDFGDFASAFGGSTSVSAATEPPSASLTAQNNDEFADFSAFQGSSTTSTSNIIAGGLEGNLLTTATPANDAFDLFNSTPSTNSNNPAMAGGATTATDLLAGLGDLSIHQSMPMGKFINYVFNSVFLVLLLCSSKAFSFDFCFPAMEIDIHTYICTHTYIYIVHIIC